MLQKRGAAFAGTDIATVKQDVGIVAEIMRPAGKLIGILRQAASIDGIAPEAQLAGTAVAEHVDGVNAAPLGRFPQRFGRDIQTIGPGCNHPDHGIARQGRHHRGIARQPRTDQANTEFFGKRREHQLRGRRANCYVGALLNLVGDGC